MMILSKGGEDQMRFGENFTFAQVRDFLLPFENEFKGIAKFIFQLLT